MKIGWIGLGNMGSVMAERALAAGHELFVYNRTASRTAPLVERGAYLADSPAAAAARAELLVTMVADDLALRNVVGPGGALAALTPGAVHVSMSTISAALAEELAASHAARQVGFVGAPVFGRPEAAAAGKLFILAAGAPEAVRKCEPLFQALGQKVLPLGAKPEAAHLTKVLGNYLLLSSVAALGDALNVARSSGVSTESVLEALTSSVFSAPFFSSYGRMLVAQNFEGPAAFTVALAKKDLDLAVSAAEAAATTLPVGEAVRSKLEALLESGEGERDVTAIGRYENV